MTAARAIGLLLGAAADGVIGRGEPVAAFAGVARALERKLPPDKKGAGVAPAAGLVGGVVVAGVLAERATRRSAVWQALGTAVATWAVLGGSRLAEDGTALARDIEEGELDAARGTLAELDPRSTGSLEVIGLSRASVESVARHTENTVVAPLFWGAVAGIPGLLGSRAVSVLRNLGHPARPIAWFAGRLDELLNQAPTRLAAGLIVTSAPVVGGSARGAWRAWQRDTVAHPRPNDGRVEAAFAGALDIRLGGRTVYPQGTVELPVLGDGRNPDAGHVTRAVELSRVVGWLSALSSAVLAALTGLRRSSR